MSFEHSPALKAGSGGDDAFTIREMMSAYRISRTALYNEIRSGRLKVMKVGSRSLITRRARRDWERLCEALPLRPAVVRKNPAR